MTGLADLRAGDIGFGPIKGGAGLLVGAGQLLLGEGFRVEGVNVRHVFVVAGVEPDRSRYCVEAMPSGAQFAPIGDRWTPAYAYARLPEDYPYQAEDAAAIARVMIGTPYSFASYAALAAWRFGIATPQLEKWIGRRRMASFDARLEGGERRSADIRLPCEAICSVLADQAWSLAGKKIFTDGRGQQCVTPGALAARLLRMDGVEWMWPGR